MKKTVSMIIALICILSMLNSCRYKHNYYTFETELGDVFTLEVYLSGNMHGMYPHYLIYDGDDSIGGENGSVLCVVKDQDQEGRLPENPVSSITTVGTYGNHNYYKIFDMLFYYQKGIYMDSLLKSFDVDEYEHYKMSPHIPNFILYDVQAMQLYNKFYKN